MTAVADLDTPAVTVELDIMTRNIRRVQQDLDALGVGFRPHIKTHKIPALGKLQIEAGAIGITCQKLGEVEVFTDAGVANDVLLTYNILGRQKTDRLMALAKRLKRLAVVLDNEVVARGLSEAAVAHGMDVRFLVECDTGLGRNGVQSPDEALALARAAMKMPRMRFEGLMTFPNRDPDTRVYLERALELFKQAGIPVPVVSGGGSPALQSVKKFPMLTEHRAGTYILRLEGADVRPLQRDRIRPRHGIRRRGDREPVGGARGRRPVEVRRAAGGRRHRPRRTEPLLRRVEHGRRGLRRAERRRRGGVACRRPRGRAVE
jgi:D-serine deaminase-like pyridoxal phosphate-dependent protein